jgi:hypothetical protein
MTRRVIKTTLAPQAVGAYSQAICCRKPHLCLRANPLDPATGNPIGEKDVKSQNPSRVAQSSGSASGSRCLSGKRRGGRQSLLKDMSDFADFNRRLC